MTEERSTAPMPTLRTERLILQPFALSDAPTVQRLAGDREVATTTLTIPHPYDDGVAEAWIGKHREYWEEQKSLALAVTTSEEGLIGAISFALKLAHRRAEVGYWIGVPFWNRGFATEAARALIDFGFDQLGLNRVEAQYFVRNPASRRVLEKVGMKFEGIRREHMVKWDVAEDVGLCAILASDR